MNHPLPSLEVEEQYQWEELHNDYFHDGETGLGTGGGIHVKPSSKNPECVILFSTGDGPYDDEIGGNEFAYIGQDWGDGDQDPDHYTNRTLIDAIDDESIVVYFFHREDNDKPWTYKGLVDVRRYEKQWHESENRYILVFTLEFSTTESRGQDPDHLHTPTTRSDEEYVSSTRRKRSQEFTRKVRSAYENTCAICGSSRETPDGRPEIEAAHIRPVEDDGPDVVQNGLALCQMHHWAFDNSWIAIRDDYTILVREAPDRTGFYEFMQYDGNTIHLPKEKSDYPDPAYLQHHRKVHDFEE